MTIQRFCRWFCLSFVVLLVTTSPAYAQTVGTVISNLTVSFASIPRLLSSVAYIMGCFWAAWGIYKFKDHVDNPSQTPLSAGVKRFLGGGMLFSMPYMVDVVRRSLFGAAALTPTTGTLRNPNPLGGGMDQMIFELVADIAGPMTVLLTAFSYISGALLLLVGISRMIKTAQDGPRGPTGLGTIMTLFVAGTLISGAGMITAFTSSLFGDATISTFANISPVVIANPLDAAKIGAVIESLMTFIMIVGVIAFLRGLFVLRAFAEGGQNATIMQALTFLFGGALAINLGDLVNVLGTTVGVAGIWFT
ncbi:MAG: hypothetical protein V1721_00585 [Pseudomonadota bacterium]